MTTIDAPPQRSKWWSSIPALGSVVAAAGCLVLGGAVTLGGERSEREMELRASAGAARGTAWLRSVQGPAGNWDQREVPQFKTGVTALCLRALLESDPARSEKAIGLASQFLLQTSLDMVADAASVTDALLVLLDKAKSVPRLLPDEQSVRQRVAACVAYLVQKQLGPSSGPGDLVGAWGYPGGSGDIVNTSLACAALARAAASGFSVPPGVWGRALDAVARLGCELPAEGPARRDQGDSRGRRVSFRYNLATAASNCTRARAVAGVLAMDHCIKRADGLGERGAEYTEMRDACDRYLASEFRDRLSLEGAYTFFWLWLVGDWQEEFHSAGFSGEDWYARGAELLLKAQGGKGSWDGQRVTSTAMAVIFLARSRTGQSPTDTPTTPR